METKVKDTIHDPRKVIFFLYEEILIFNSVLNRIAAKEYKCTRIVQKCLLSSWCVFALKSLEFQPHHCYWSTWTSLSLIEAYLSFLR